MMGWRNLAFSAMDDATAKIQEAREALRDRKGTPEDFVLALLAATQTLNEAITCAVGDGVPNLCKPNAATYDCPECHTDNPNSHRVACNVGTDPKDKP